MDATELEALVDDLAASARTLAEYLRRSPASPPSVPLAAPADVHQAQQTVLKNALKIQTLLTAPASIVRHLAIQVSAPHVPLVWGIRPDQAHRRR
jgi:hypothetical protein